MLPRKEYKPRSPEHPLRAFFVGMCAVVSTIAMLVLGASALAVLWVVAVIAGLALFIKHLIFPSS